MLKEKRRNILTKYCMNNELLFFPTLDLYLTSNQIILNVYFLEKISHDHNCQI